MTEQEQYVEVTKVQARARELATRFERPRREALENRIAAAEGRRNEIVGEISTLEGDLMRELALDPDSECVQTLTKRRAELKAEDELRELEIRGCRDRMKQADVEDYEQWKS